MLDIQHNIGEKDNIIYVYISELYITRTSLSMVNRDKYTAEVGKCHTLPSNVIVKSCLTCKIWQDGERKQQHTGIN